MVLKILVGCEESQTIAKAFRQLGHEAFSNDTQDSSGGHSDWHLKMDVFKAIEAGELETESGEKVFIKEWDMAILNPPCTDLAVSGAKHFAIKIADGRQKKALDFVSKLMQCNIKYWALENPVSVISSAIRKPDQIIQPWQFGDPFQKTTCLWLKGLPKLTHTCIVDKGEFVTTPSGKKLPKWYSDNKSAKLRSKTFPGIANAMADQWSKYLITQFSPV